MNQAERVFALVKRGPITCNDLAAELGTSRTVMSNALSRLSARGFVNVTAQGEGYLWYATSDGVPENRLGNNGHTVPGMTRQIRRGGSVPVPMPRTELEKAWGWFPCA